MKKRYLSPSVSLEGMPCRLCRKILSCRVLKIKDMIVVVDDVLFCRNFCCRS